MAEFKQSSIGNPFGGGGGAAAPIRPRTNFLAQPKLLKTSSSSSSAPSSSASSSAVNPFLRAENGGDEEAIDLFAPKAAAPSSPQDDGCEDGGDAAVPKFVPLHSSREGVSFAGGTAAPAPDISCASDFVFGQNLEERIVNRPPDEGGEGSTATAAATTAATSANAAEHASSNGTSERSLFSAVPPDNRTPAKNESNSLAESAETWERIRESSMPSLPPQQEIFTGEEGETNQLQLNCRIFAFEGGVWKERGRGQLRLNDGQSCSRLVCRSSGSLRIMLNTKIWGGMTVERPGLKSLRITATDPQQQLKIFLIMANPDEISHLHDMLSLRVILAQKAEKLNNTCDSSNSEHNNENGASEASSSQSELPSEEPPQSPKVSGEEEIDESETTCSSLTERSANTPVVVVSNEDDDVDADADVKETLKRPKADEGSNCVPKKMCMEFPTEDDGTPL